MITGKYELCGELFELRTNYAATHELWKDYASGGEDATVIEITPEDMKFETEKAYAAAEREGRAGKIGTPDVLETLAVYRKVSEALLDRGVFLFHGSAIAVDGEGYLFTAVSGTGKSTHTALWRKLFGERAVMINDDKPMISVTSGGAAVHGTPYNGKHGLGSNVSAPLRAICILERGGTNNIREISGVEAYRTLVQQMYRPRSGEALAKSLTLLDALMKHVRFYRLSCNMELDAARIAYEGMRGENK